MPSTSTARSSRRRRRSERASPGKRGDRAHGRDADAHGFLAGKVTPLLRAMTQFPAPTFAAVQGACLGVGLGLAIATDVVYVAENAKIGSPFANLGATLDSGGHWLFTERLGAHRTGCVSAGSLNVAATDSCPRCS